MKVAEKLPQVQAAVSYSSTNMFLTDGDLLYTCMYQLVDFQYPIIF